MTVRNLAFVLLAVTFGSPSHAYIPDFKMILSRTAENHGRGTFQIVQDVILQEEPEQLVVRETWYVKNENQMRLEVRGRHRLEGVVSMSFLYDGSRRLYIDPNGAKKVSRASDDWFEPYFHFRFQKNIKPKMVAAKMAPTEILEEEKRKSGPYKPNEARRPQPYLRLGRVGGVVAYAVGEPTTVGASDGASGIWIEQDQFLVRKIRFPSQSTVVASDYSSYTNQLFYPNRMTVTWGNRAVQIQVVGVVPLADASKAASLLKESSLDFGKDPSVAVKIPDLEILTDFYKRFR